MDKMIYISLINEQIAAAETELTAEKHIHEMLQGVAMTQVQNSKEKGEFSRRITIHTRYVRLEK